MNLKINKNRMDNPEMDLKRAGFAYIYSHHTGQGSFVRRLTRDHYPRIHLYAEDHGDFYVLSLHVDQKKVSYRGSHAHNADYDGPVVEGEIVRLQELFGGEVVSKKTKQNEKQKEIEEEIEKQDTVIDIPSAEKSIGQGNLDDLELINTKPKKNWLQRFFNF